MESFEGLHLESCETCAKFIVFIRPVTTIEGIGHFNDFDLTLFKLIKIIFSQELPEDYIDVDINRGGARIVNGREGIIQGKNRF